MTMFFSAIKDDFMSLINDESLNIDFIVDGGFFKKSSSNVDNDKFYNIEARLQKIFGKLTSYTNNHLNVKLINFLQILTTNNSCVPSSFFTFFERTRISFSDNLTLNNLNQNQKDMIICFFVLVKILVKQIFIEYPNKESIENSNVKKNLKMIASIIYRSIVDYFSGLIPQDPTSKKNSLFKQYGMGTMKYLSVPKSDMSKHEDYNLGYFNAMKSNIEKINNEKKERYRE